MVVAEFVFGYYGSEAGPLVLRAVDLYTDAVRSCPGGTEFSPSPHLYRILISSSLDPRDPHFILTSSSSHPRLILTRPHLVAGHGNPLCRIVDWTHISRHSHAMDPGDDGEYPKPWLNASVVLGAADLFAQAVAGEPLCGCQCCTAVSMREYWTDLTKHSSLL